MSELTATSKFLSYVLRHHPEAIGLELDNNGWANISELVTKANKHNKDIDEQLIRRVIEYGNKQRFIVSDDGNFIRAGYGHSVDVNLQLTPQKPPKVLYHGTAQNNVSGILEKGITAQSRNFVHLSATKQEASKVGSRHGRPVILDIEALAMHEEGYEYYQSGSEKSIWLTKSVPPAFILDK